MSAVASEGRTVLFVTHNLGALSRLCDSGLLLEAGRVAAQGTIAEVISEYGRLQYAADEETGTEERDGASVSSMGVRPGGETLSPSSMLRFAFTLSVRRRYWAVQVYLGIATSEEKYIAIEVVDSDRFPEFLKPGCYRIEVQFPPIWLRPGGYSVWAKVIAHPHSGPRERFFAHRLEIVVNGASNVDETADRLLAPATHWTVEVLEEPRDLASARLGEVTS